MYAPPGEDIVSGQLSFFSIMICDHGRPDLFLNYVCGLAAGEKCFKTLLKIMNPSSANT